jgi:iron complex outermembrane receptor protein
MNVRWLGGTALAASLCIAAPAFAQDATPAVAEEAVQEDGEIVVTAQRREQRLSEVPISITAITGEQLTESGVVSSTDLATVTPGLQYPISGAFAQPTIRGIGTTVTSAGSDPNVALYVDGVYQPSQAANIFNFNNIERIEVLKGPQGTLYGRNATGGAINVTTALPSLTDVKAKLGASYGSFDEVRLNAYVSVPLGGVAALSVAGLYTDDNGYARDILRNVNLANYDERAIRGKLLVQPSDSFQLILAGDWSRKYDSTGYSLKPLNGNTAQNVTIAPDPYDLKLNFSPYSTTESKGGSATLKLDAGDYTLSSITALRRVDAFFKPDLDRTEINASSTEFATRQRTFTQEFNVASGDIGAFSFVAGAFYYKDRADHFNFRTNNVPGVTGRIDSEALAGYAEGTLEFGQLSVVGGIRYSTEQREYTASRPTGTPLAINAKVRYDAWTPRVSLRYDLGGGTNVYASYNNGFKSGTYNISGFSTVPVRPEEVDAYEVGVKHYSGGMTINAAGFLYNYSDIQVQAIQVATGLTALTNAAKARIYGAELEFNAPVGGGFGVNAGLAYTHGEYTSFPGALITTPRTTGCGVNPNRPCGNTQGPGDASGNVMVRTPELTLNLTGNYEGNVAGGTFRASLTGSYNSGFFWDVGNRVEQPKHLLVNGRLSWGPESGLWRVSLWGRNLTDKRYHLYATDTTQADAVSWARPRSVGVALDLDFD